MRYNFLRIIVLTIALAAFAGMPVRAQKITDTLVILHTNDVHSQIQPKTMKAHDGVPAHEEGGVLPRMALLEQVRAKYEKVLLFDAGDFSQSTSYYEVFKGFADIEVMNQMGYVAATLGNHEFDRGTGHLDTLLRTAHFPVVCANYVRRKSCPNNYLQMVKPYAIIDTFGLKIGVFGVVITLDRITAHPEVLAKEYQYVDALKTAKKYSKYLKKKEKCDLVICLSHLGDVEDTNNKGSHDLDVNLAAQCPCIDILIGGHKHHTIEGKDAANGTFYVQNRNQGVEIGMFKIPLRRK